MKYKYQKSVSFRHFSLKVVIKNRIVTSKNAMFENNPRVINENKKIAELNFILSTSIIGLPVQFIIIKIR